MSLPNRLQLQTLCDQIKQLVEHEKDLDFLFHQGDVRITVASGPHAALDDAFMKALGKYMMAMKHPHSGTDQKKAKEDFDTALAEYVARRKLGR